MALLEYLSMQPRLSQNRSNDVSISSCVTGTINDVLEQR